MANEKQSLTEEVRILGRAMAEELTAEEIEQVSGAVAVSTNTDDGKSCDA